MRNKAGSLKSTATTAQASAVAVTLKRAIGEALEVFEPPEHLTVSEWADRYRVMSSEETSRPGLWNTSEYAYSRFIMDCFNDDAIREIVLLKCTQIGGTEMLLNMLGYTVDHNPSRIYYVLPDDDLCKKFSEMRLAKMFTSCAERFRHKVEPKNDAKFIKFAGGFIAIASSRSPSELGSWSVPIVLLDEVDKFPVWSGKEANPIKLAEERTKNWPVAKVVKVSTPTIKTGAIYRAYEATDVKYQYEMPCPHCGKFITFTFNNVKWPKDENGNADPTVALYQAYYSCPECNGRIDNRHKSAMLKNGRWRALNTVQGRATSVGFRINSLYSPWLSFGAVAVEFLTSKDSPENLMNFINSWLGEPWENKAATLERDQVLEQQTEVPEGVVPRWAQLLTGGIDVQKNGVYWTVRAWGYPMTSQNVAHGWAPSLYDAGEIMNRMWPDEDGTMRWQVDLCGIDSGYNSEDVYEFCLMNSDWAVPVKGASTTNAARFRRSQIDSLGKQYHGQSLYIVNGDAYKDMIAARLRRPIGPGAWMVYAGCDMDYAEQITSEHKIATVKGGRRVESWVPKTSHADNHYLDAEVYASLAADLLQVRYLSEQSEPTGVVESVPGRQKAGESNEAGGEFININGGWL